MGKNKQRMNISLVYSFSPVLSFVLESSCPPVPSSSSSLLPSLFSPSLWHPALVLYLGRKTKFILKNIQVAQQVRVYSSSLHQYKNLSSSLHYYVSQFEKKGWSVNQMCTSEIKGHLAIFDNINPWPGKYFMSITLYNIQCLIISTLKTILIILLHLAFSFLSPSWYAFSGPDTSSLSSLVCLSKPPAWFKEILGIPSIKEYSLTILIPDKNRSMIQLMYSIYIMQAFSPSILKKF